MKTYLYGASGHGKVIADILEENGLRIEGFIDDNENLHKIMGYPVITPQKAEEGRYIISIGNNKIRKDIAERYHDFLTAIHPRAIISKHVSLGEGTVVMAGAIINPDTQVGKHCIINTGASVDHDNVIDDYVHVSPHATLCGGVQVGEGTWIGAGTTVKQYVKIGKWCTIGANSTVLHDVPDGVTIYGVF